MICFSLFCGLGGVAVSLRVTSCFCFGFLNDRLLCCIYDGLFCCFVCLVAFLYGCLLVFVSVIFRLFIVWLVLWFVLVLIVGDWRRVDLVTYLFCLMVVLGGCVGGCD